MKPFSLCSCLAALGVLFAATQTPVRADDAADEARPITLTAPAKVGETVRYRTTLTMSVGADITVEQVRKHVVKEVKDNKEVIVVVHNEGGKFLVNGTENEIPATAEITMTLDRINRVLTFKPRVEDNPYLSSSTLHLLTMAETIVLPEKPVKPGESWTTEADNPQVKGKKVKIKTTYDGTAKLNDMPAWKVTQELEADTEFTDTRLKVKVTAFLDPATGQLIQAEQTASGIPSQQGPIEWKGKIERSPSAPREKAS
ncbi:MAG: hypothetical protein RMJ43_01060 [Chloroherpetonaceae bacterium]|nr:hypothetical protein [Chthonomonadaceae bacterium]MDW8206398.1 hypothetical protein [Chloroherpetonaceae bacterium]